MSTVSIAPTCDLYYAKEPQLKDESGSRSWVTRSANVVVVVSEVKAGTELRRYDNPDEYMVLLPPGLRGRARADGKDFDIDAESLTILPPGTTTFTALNDGHVTRVFSARAKDLTRLASNAKEYANGAPAVGPLEYWPTPVGGFKVRTYKLADYTDPKIFGRIFRSTNLMINIFERKTDRRDPRKLTPHSHADFEQISLALEGTFIHHLRTPWAADSSAWRDDEHLEVGSPSVLVIPINLVHTTQDIGDGVVWLIDIFGPPRRDFSNQPGVVRNATEYPMPTVAN